MKEDNRVIQAARMASFFRIDPVEALDAGYFEWAVRTAAFEVAVEERNAAIDKANKENT